MDLRTRQHWLALFDEMASAEALIEATASRGESVMTRQVKDLMVSPVEDEGWARADRAQRTTPLLEVRSSGRDDMQCVSVRASASGAGALYATPFPAGGETAYGIIVEVAPLADALQAIVTADVAGWRLRFGDPVYFEDAERLAGALAGTGGATLSLAAVAFWLDLVDEARLADWGVAREHGHIEPDRSVRPDEKVFPDWLRILGKVAAVEHCLFGGCPLAKLTVVVRTGTEDLRIPVYAAPKALLGGKDPVAGDVVWGAVWLTGYLDRNWPHRPGGLLDRW